MKSAMKARSIPFKTGRAEEWPRERIAQLGKVEIQQLRDNAERLGEPELATLCDEVIKDLPKAARLGAGERLARTKARSLTSRGKAFEARGVWLDDSRTSWSGVRKVDGVVVMTIWAAGVESGNGGCAYLLWAPNTDGVRPWSDSAAGKERLEHCKLALKGGGAEGLLVYGERLEGRLPEDKARTVHGVDSETVLRFKVEKRGDEFWATWGKRTFALSK